MPWETCNHDLDSPVAQHNLRDDAFPDFQPEFRPVLLSRKSSLVDFVHATGAVGGTGLLVSEKALGVLEGIGSERELKRLIEAKRADYHWLGGLAALYPVINDRLKSALEKAGVTGYELRQQPNIVMPGA